MTTAITTTTPGQAAADLHALAELFATAPGVPVTVRVWVEVPRYGPDAAGHDQRLTTVDVLAARWGAVASPYRLTDEVWEYTATVDFDHGVRLRIATDTTAPHRLCMCGAAGTPDPTVLGAAA
jgi:hypothetical protein